MVKIIHTGENIVAYVLYCNVQDDPETENKIPVTGSIIDAILNIDIPAHFGMSFIHISYNLETNVLLSRHPANFSLVDCYVLEVANHKFIIIGSCLVCAEGQIRKSYKFVVSCYSMPQEVSVLAMPE